MQYNQEATIACFAWGVWFDRKVEYVKKLFNGIQRNMNGARYRFVVLTDEPLLMNEELPKEIFIEPIPKYVMRWAGNLKKMYIYCPELAERQVLVGNVLLLDLDIVITGDINSLVFPRGQLGLNFITCRGAFMKNKRSPGGSVIWFKAGSRYLEALLFNPMLSAEDRDYFERETGGSERKYFAMRFPNPRQMVFWDDFYPDYIRSYKRDCRSLHTLPEQVRIVRFHGKPRLHQVKKITNQWVKENWI